MSDLLDKLLTRKKKTKKAEQSHFNVLIPNFAQQADLLQLPEDKGYKYLLVVIDDHSKALDAEPLKNKDSQTVANALGRIYKRDILKQPRVLECDSGSEFNGHVLTYLKNNKIRKRTAIVGRHKMQAVVERANQSIQKILFKRMAAIELITGEVNREWVDELPNVITRLNEVAKQKPKPKRLTGPPIIKKPLLKVGQKVRVALEEPRDILTTNKKLHGKFRTGDIRFDPTPRTIFSISLKPGSPPLYLLNDPKRPGKPLLVGYSRNELQTIDDDEIIKNPEQYFKNGAPKKYRISEIIGNKMVKKTLYFLIKWYGYSKKDATWEPAKNIVEDVPQMAKDYMIKNKLI